MDASKYLRDYKTGPRGITNRDSVKDFKSGQKDYKLEQKFQIWAKRFQIGAEITNRGKIDYKPGRGLQIGAEHSLPFKKSVIHQWKLVCFQIL